jgi:acetyl esterase/lipase
MNLSPGPQVIHRVAHHHSAPRLAPAGPPPADRGVSVRTILDVPYAEGGDARHKLDLYLPDRVAFPVVVFAHGGGWVSGDKVFYGHLGHFFAKHGVGAVLVNYRLSPRVRFPAPAQDLARAFAWTAQHVPAYGGDADRLFLCGHSAGGHLASLLATDEGYLRAECLSLEHVRGVIPISGVYVIHWNVVLYGVGALFRGVDKAAASPFRNVKPGCPPFLIAYAEREVWTLAGQAVRFHERLLVNHCRSRLTVAAGENHRSIIDNLVLPSSEFGQDIVRFISGV